MPYVKCVVACVDASGVPALVPYKVEMTRADIDSGEHYDVARSLAAEDGYEQTDCAVVFDDTDGPAWLFARLFPEDSGAQ